MIRQINALVQKWWPEATADELAAKALQEARVNLLTAQAAVEADKAAQAHNLANLAMYEERVKRLTRRKPDATSVVLTALPDYGVVDHE